jgi:hypothetical protein
MVGGTFSMTGGFISAAKKGFHPVISTGGGYGTGTAGYPAAPSYNPGGGTPGGETGVVNSSFFMNYGGPFTPGQVGMLGINDGPLCLSNIYGNDQLKASFSGEQGGEQNQYTGPARIKSSGIQCFYFNDHSSYSNNDLHLGCSGKDAESFGATGGSGGGFGGKGGNFGGSPFTAGDIGYIGEDGKAGGTAGTIGIGGGIIYLKVANSSLSFPGSRTRIYANGENGGNGGNGGDGGVGGTGGRGANGNCDGGILVAPGGWGGFGEGGEGGHGATGGAAGCGGTVWVLKKSGGTHTSFGSYVNVKSGKGGKGGSAGLKFTHQGNRNARRYELPLDALSCNTPQKFELCDARVICIPEKCDCDEVFRHLGEDMTGAVSITTPVVGDWSISQAGQSTLFWNKINLELSYTKTATNGCQTIYRCKMRDGLKYIRMMDKVFAQAELTTYGGVSNDPGFNLAGFYNGKTTMSYGAHLILEYDPAPTPSTLIDYDDPINPQVTEDACAVTNDKAAKAPSKGSKGLGGGDIPGGETNEHTVEEDDVLVIGEPTGSDGEDRGDQVDGDFDEDQEIQSMERDKSTDILEGDNHVIMPTIEAIKGHIIITSPDHKQTKYTLYSMDGKLVEEGLSTKSSVKLNNLRTGIYILLIEKNTKREKIKVFVP